MRQRGMPPLRLESMQRMRAKPAPASWGCGWGRLGLLKKRPSLGLALFCKWGVSQRSPGFVREKSARLSAPRQVLRVTSYNRCGHNLLSFCSTPPLQIREGSPLAKTNYMQCCSRPSVTAHAGESNDVPFS